MLISFIRHLIVFFITQSFLFSVTNNVIGVLIESDNQEPVSNANIFIDKQNIGTTTDQNGYFLLAINNFSKKEIILNIKVIGYDEKRIPVNLKTETIDLGFIIIDKKPIQLEPVKIHSHKNQSNQISDIIISGKELNKNLRGNIATTLLNYSNIGINSFGSAVSKPSLRGFSGDRLLLTKNGNETGDLSQSSIDHVITIDMSEINQIEIIRGPKSLVYGPNAIGGVINTSLVGSPRFKVDKFHQKLLIGGESFNNGFYGSSIFYFPFKDNQINVFLSNKNTDNEISSDGELKNTQSNINNYNVGFTRYKNNAYINFVVEDFNMDYGIPPNPGGHITGVDILLNKKTAEINYHQDILSDFFKHIDIKYSFVDYIHLELVNGSINSNDIFEIFDQGNFHVGLAKKTHSFQFEFSSINSTLGLDFNKKKFSPSGFYLSPETNEDYLSMYGFHEWEKNESNFNFLSSFRLGYLSSDPDLNNIQYVNLDSSKVKKRIFNTASFSFGIIKKINQLELNSWIMHTMRPPRVEELYSDGPHLGTYAYEIGNPELKAEKIYGIENSIKFNDNPLKLSLVTFYNYSPYYYEMAQIGDCPEALEWDLFSGTSHPCAGEDFIDWGSGEFGFLYKYKSRGSEAVIKGFEFDLEYKLEKFLLSYNFSFLEGDNKSINRPLSYMSPIKQILSLDYIDSSFNYKLRFSKIHAQERLGEFETYTAGAFLTDIVVTYNYKMHDIVIQFNNIFDKKYYNHLSRIKSINPEAGKNIHLIYKVFF